MLKSELAQYFTDLGTELTTVGNDPPIELTSKVELALGCPYKSSSLGARIETAPFEQLCLIQSRLVPGMWHVSMWLEEPGRVRVLTVRSAGTTRRETFAAAMLFYLAEVEEAKASG